MKNYQKRDKFFYAVPSMFPVWNYPSRLAIGMKLSDFKARNAPEFKFLVKGKYYTISREKAIEMGGKYKLSFGALPNLIPIEEFEVSDN